MAPTSLGLCGDSTPSIKPLNDNYLPAEGNFEVFMSNERHSTAWYAVDFELLDQMLRFTGRHLNVLPMSSDVLDTQDDVLELAERWLEASCPKWLMGWRDIALRSVERTVIASVVPLSAVSNKIPLFLFGPEISRPLAAAFLANLSALVFDFVARQKIGGTTLNYFYMKQFPVLPPQHYSEKDLAYIAPRVLELTYTAHDLEAWAAELGYLGPPFKFDPVRRARVRAELDAYYARLYGLSRDELLYILDPAEVKGPDYPTETFRVLKASEQKEFGEYLTARLVLEAWDQLHAGAQH